MKKEEFQSIIRLAIDGESGDFGPKVILSGIVEAKKSIDKNIKFFICGSRQKLEHAIKELGIEKELEDCEIVECSEMVDPGKKRASVWKTQKDTSIIRCITLQKEGLADASISAGDTGILMGASLFILGRKEGVSRPALAARLPTIKKKPVLLLDVGANLSCRAEHLVSFAELGDFYLQRVAKVTSPSIGLLTIGKESIKGTKEIGIAHSKLKDKKLNYIGFIEGSDILAGDVDIVVCDGFCGNIVLKLCESFHKLIRAVIDHNSEIEKKISIFDPENYGAVPFLGIKGTVLKAHGSSSPRAIANAIHTAINNVISNREGNC